MTDQELKKLSRKDLLELLISQGRERDGLQAELEKTKAALRERQLCMEETGSIAEAALRLNGVFEAAQAAAQQYLENARQRSESVEADCARRDEESRQKAAARLQEAAKAVQEMEAETLRRCQAMENEAKEKSEAYWNEVSARLEAFYREHEGLKEMLSAGGRR